MQPEYGCSGIVDVFWASTSVSATHAYAVDYRRAQINARVKTTAQPRVRCVR